MCRVLEVTPSGYYAWRRAPEGRVWERNRSLLSRIERIHAESRGTYGSPKVTRKLRRDGEEVNHKRVERLMQAHGIRSKRARKYKATTDSSHSLPVAENVLARNFSQEVPDAVWCGDLTYVHTEEGWLYLAVFIDLYSRLVVGWAGGERMTAELVLRALDMGLMRRGERVSPLIHTDRGSQYASSEFRARLSTLLCQQSMSRKGNCWDNSVAESFFATLKLELIHGRRFATRKDATDQIFEYIEIFYNRTRIHSAADYLSPAEFEMRVKQAA